MEILSYGSGDGYYDYNNLIQGNGDISKLDDPNGSGSGYGNGFAYGSGSNGSLSVYIDSYRLNYANGSGFDNGNGYGYGCGDGFGVEYHEYLGCDDGTGKFY